MVKGPPMHRRETRVRVVPGPGVVGRFGDVLVWLEEGEAPSPAVVAGLLDIARSLAEGARGDEVPAGQRLAEVLRREPAAVPAMVLVVPGEDDLHAVVHGWGRLVTDDAEIDGGWVDRRLAWTASFAAGRGGAILHELPAGGVHDLRRGTTPGGGLAVTRAEPVADPPPAEPAGPGPDAPVPQAAAPAEGDTGVKGVVCGQGHVSNPAAAACETCGASLHHGTRILTHGVRPSLGSLVLDDGTTFELDAGQVLGSDPEAAAPVAAGDADPIVLDDPSGQVAPVHAEVRLVGWEVVLVPRADTLVLAPGTERWVPARLDEPVPLPDGSRVAIGSRTLTVHLGAAPPGS